MHTMKITRTLALAGFAPAGKLSHLYGGFLPVLALLVATLGKLDWGKRTYAVLVLCAATAMALPAQTFTTLASFDGTDGWLVYTGLVQATNGDLYGTTSGGGNCAAPYNCGDGTVFKITPSGTLTTLYSFCPQLSGCTDGVYPYGALVQATNGDFYGTTNYDGAYGGGTVFKMTPSGTLTTLYNFCSQSGCTDGEYPNAWLVQAANGDFYGTAEGGGANGQGTVFKITPSGALTTLYSFCSQSNCMDGSAPYAGLVQATNGDFYGTTCGSGCYGSGPGTVFKITPSNTLTTLYSFCSQTGCTDGEYPEAGLVQATNGDFYGTTFGGGANNNPYCSDASGVAGCGTVFKITPSGTLTTLHGFAGYPTDGGNPYAGLIQATDGNFYGTTFDSGANDCGTVFRITPTGTLTTLYSFAGYADGASPYAGLVQATNGDFYGTTFGGGTSTGCPYGTSCGTVFSLSVGLGPFVETRRTYGTVGAIVEILGTVAGASSVSFNGTAAPFIVIQPSLITARVPPGATTGTVQVVTPSGTLSSNVPFRVLP